MAAASPDKASAEFSLADRERMAGEIVNILHGYIPPPLAYEMMARLAAALFRHDGDPKSVLNRVSSMLHREVAPYQEQFPKL